MNEILKWQHSNERRFFSTAFSWYCFISVFYRVKFRIFSWIFSLNISWGEMKCNLRHKRHIKELLSSFHSDRLGFLPQNHYKIWYVLWWFLVFSFLQLHIDTNDIDTLIFLTIWICLWFRQNYFFIWFFLENFWLSVMNL